MKIITQAMVDTIRYEGDIQSLDPSVLSNEFIVDDMIEQAMRDSQLQVRNQLLLMLL
jgi:hypothetical protein